MRGVCLDSGNLTGRPSYAKLVNLGCTGYRMEMRDTDEFYTYYASLRRLNSCLLVGPSTEDTSKIATHLPHEPDVVIIGNEPDFDGESSWTMTPTEYINLWRDTAPLFPHSALCVAGMLIKDTNYLSKTLPGLNPHPTYVNVHYPDTELDLARFMHYGSVIVGEWTWATGTAQEIVDWHRLLVQYTRHSFWFCWSEGMVPEHGLVSATGQKLNTYYSYKEALASRP